MIHSFLVRWWKLGVFVLLVVAVIAFARIYPVADWLQALNAWMAEAGPIGWAVFAAVYILVSVFGLPASVLTIGAGFAFGLVTGVILVSVSSTLGAATAFLVSRYLARDFVVRKFGKGERFEAVDQAVGREGAKIVFMLRLSPVFPFVALNYLLGLTAVPFWRYVPASWVGMIPGTILYVYLGYAGRAGLETAAGEAGSGDTLKLAYTIVGLIVTAIVTVYVTRLARRALEKRSEIDKAAE